MTTTVTVSAHCDPQTTEVLVEFSDAPESPVTLQDGESCDYHVWDDIAISVREVQKSLKSA